MRIQPLGKFLFNAIESPTANVQNILRIDRNHFLVGTLALTLGRHIHHRTFQQFQQSLLHLSLIHISITEPCIIAIVLVVSIPFPIIFIIIPVKIKVCCIKVVCCLLYTSKFRVGHFCINLRSSDICMSEYFAGRRYAWHRKPGFEYLLLDTEECQGAEMCIRDRQS